MTGVFSFWRGDISWVERCSAASMAAHGLKLTVFTPHVALVRSSGLVADVRDAREVLDDPSIDWLLASRADYWSDIFRVEGLALGRGAWVDLDLIFIKPLPQQDYLIGRNGRGINNAVLKLPVGSPALTDYLSLCRQRPLPLVAPYQSWPCRILSHLDIARKRLLGRRLPPPALGGGTLAHIVGFVFRRILRPDEKNGRYSRKPFDQFPWLRQVIKETATEDRIEFSELRELCVLQICLGKFDILHLEKLLDESRLAQICLAAFQRDDALYAGALRHDESVGPF